MVKKTKISTDTARKIVDLDNRISDAKDSLLHINKLCTYVIGLDEPTELVFKFPSGGRNCPDFVEDNTRMLREQVDGALRSMAGMGLDGMFSRQDEKMVWSADVAPEVLLPMLIGAKKYYESMIKEYQQELESI